MNPGHEPQITTHEIEPAWIRDHQAAAIDLDLSEPETIPQMIAEICEGEKSYCEHCGFLAPMWPTKGWGDHLMTEHAGNLTIQARTGTSLMCEEGLNQAQQMFFSLMLSARVSMRRRGFRLGYLIVKLEPSRLARPTN